MRFYNMKRKWFITVLEDISISSDFIKLWNLDRRRDSNEKKNCK